MSQPVARFGVISGMIETADNLARDYDISRTACDAYAARSHQRATAAWAAGKFDDELVPVAVPQKRGEPVIFARDEGIRGDATAESLGQLRPLEKDGVVTAGNASQQNDAGAACLIVAEDKLEELGLEPIAWFHSWAAAGCEPSRMGIGPVPASRKALEKAGLKVADMDVIEANEAFAAQALAVNKDLGWNPEIINVNGGAYVDESTMIDTWSTVGSCAQIGKRVHISGGVGIGGVLEPLQAGPVIIEDDCFIGARSEIVEGVIVEKGAVISMGVFIGQSTPIFDREKNTVSYGRVPAGSVVVAGSLPRDNGRYSINCAVIVNPGSVGCPGYRDVAPFPHRMETGTPDACYAILAGDGERWQVTFRHVPYDHDAMAALARQTERLEWASALATGWIRRGPIPTVARGARGMFRMHAVRTEAMGPRFRGDDMRNP
eukprot:gene31939-42614_t